MGGLFNQGLLRKSVQKDYQEEIRTGDDVANDESWVDASQRLDPDNEWECGKEGNNITG